ncbi:ABC transporter ATP-binding protein [Candidatus Cryosericum septentrionale]|jgi:ATP-binding cassette subfamily B multidrug efflux pump|uniref:ABC transporter ATP-binding protein n=1 Tax=Candidatus Cryosericum septentrionale TaxID=2290913 RepID=A0A398E122_9BACT|nr:ABC transporter ATP-binding protein [Candidatus Cryosericum septentrionale]RIE16341.1 ABC transporter ATP-binding protein [Candidatus Cryosericum septentrionale]
MRNFLKILTYLRPYRRKAVIALAALTVSILTDLAVPRLIQTIVDNGISKGDMHVVLGTMGIMLGVSALGAVVSIINTRYSVDVAMGFGTDVRTATFRNIQGFSFSNLDDNRTGALMTNLTSDVTRVQGTVQMAMRIMTRAPLMLLGSIVLMLVTSPSLAVWVVLLLAITGAMVVVLSTKAQPIFLRVQAKLDRLNTLLQENLAGMRLVKAFVRSNEENRRFGVVNDDLMDQNVRVQRLFAVIMPTMTVIVNLGTVLVILIGGRQAIGGTLTTGQLMAFINYLMITMFPLLMMGNLLVMLSQAEASAGRINGVLDTKSSIVDQPGVIDLSDVRGRVAFEHITFSYDHECGESVLQDVNFVAEPGQTVAILGETGSGKTTLINLIPRFYDVCGGRVTVDGVDVRDVTLASLRKHVGIALQEAVLFTGTLRDNIRYGRPDASQEEVEAAAQAAQAEEFILGTPKGYDTMVEERGANLSGGQKQRIAIARALLLKPSILILDDSTSAVDVDTEARIQEALLRLHSQCTVFIVAQRISTVLAADKILVLDKGRIAAEGTHQELMQTSSIYREIYESQLGGGTTNG